MNHKASRRAVLASLAAIALPRPAWAATDLLDMPALRSGRAAKALLMAVARAGSRIVAVGERGIVVHSDDEGATWTQGAVPVSVTLTAVHFPTARVGWAVGHDGIVLRTDDAGATWSKRFDGNDANALVVADARKRLEAAQAGAGADATERTDAEMAVEDAAAGAEFGPSRPLLGVWFRTPEDGIVVGSYGQIFRTGDGGASWRSLGPRMENPGGLHYNAVSGTANGTLLIAGESGQVYRSADGGESWRTLDTGTIANLFGVVVLPGDALLAFGFGGKILRRDDGAAWRMVASPTSRALVGAVAHGDALVLVDAAGGSIVSTDAGNSFLPSRPPGSAPVVGALATATGRLILVGAGGARVVPLAV